MTAERRIFGLDVLRSIAILAVVLAHGLVFLYPHVPRAGLLGYFGAVGVDLFFVLSGFLIGGILLRTGDALGAWRGLAGFWTRRWLRTLPNYYLFAGLVVLLGVVVWEPSPPWWRGVWQTLTFTQSLAWRADSGFFPEAWTLAIEEWFYFGAPLAILAGLRLGLRFRTVFLGVLTVLLAVPLALRFLAPAAHDWAEALRKFVIYRLDSIAWGLAAAWCAQAAPTAWARWRIPAAVAGAVLVVGAYVLLWTLDLATSRYIRTLHFTQFAAGYALLLPWASQWRSESNHPAARFVRATARWSYSMYLCNLSFLLLALKFLEPQFRASAAVAWLLFAGYFAACYLTSALAYALWERRFLALRERLPWTRGETPTRGL